MGLIEVLFDPETGGTARVAESLSSDAPGHLWKVICEDDAVSILADQGDGKVGLIGAGRWTGKGIGQRYATGDPIDQRSWGKIEYALRCAFADPAAAAAAAESAVASARRPPATVDPAESGYTELIVELASGSILYQRRSRTDRRVANGFEWKVVVDGERVTVHASDEDSCARATWDGERLTDREVRSKRRTINDYQWGVVEKAVIEVITGRPAPMPPRMSSGAAAGVAVEPAAARAPAGKNSGKDRRSGWWALAAAGVALAGTIASWQAMPPGDGVALAVTIALAVVTLGLVIYGGVGLGTRCPSCRAWYRRETTSTDVLGTSTTSRTISKPVYDSSGKQTGTTSELATYEVTNYRYHYRCKECSHRWTGTGSSERRIS